MPPAVRPAFEALWNLDLAFADVVATSSQPALGAIRLAWWRERLEELDTGNRISVEPRLAAVRENLIKRGVTGSELSQLEDAWLPLLEPFPWKAEAAEGLRLRGRLLFGVGGRLLEGDPAHAAAAGALWSLVDGATHCSDAASRALLRSAALDAFADVPAHLPAKLRPLTILAALASYDVMPRGRLGRGGAALAHRLRGTIRRD